MKRLLVIHSSPSKNSSVTRQLAEHYIQQWNQQNPDGLMIERDLALTPPPHLDEETIGAFYTPEADRTPEQVNKIAFSDELIDELITADAIVIGSPMHNFSISSLLKAWVDQIARVGKTFQYTENGPVGLIQDKPVHLIIARGGRYGEESPARAMNHQDNYLRTVLGFVGLSNVNVISAEALSSSTEGVDLAKQTITDSI